MANLAVCACFSVNGVSQLHSDILKSKTFADYYKIWPGKFTNVTNGISQRRWLCEANPGLSELITDLIGDKFKTDPMELSRLLAYKDDKSVLSELERIKRENKVKLSEYVKRENGLVIDPDSIFSAHAKRLHEYKRQLLCIFGILNAYFAIKDNPAIEMRPMTFFFGAKAFPGYTIAKKILSLICNVAELVNNDPSINGRIKVVFLEDYKVSVAELLIPAAEISEQISLAGKEASGTGNMKFMMNGALTVGTLDGANVEMYSLLGGENMFLFGLRADEVEKIYREQNYAPTALYREDPRVRRVADKIFAGFSDKKSYSEIITGLLTGNGGMADSYMVIRDFDAYIKAKTQCVRAYDDRGRWNSMSLVNIAKSGIFSSDRSIAEYAENIWKVPIKKQI